MEFNHASPAFRADVLTTVLERSVDNSFRSVLYSKVNTSNMTQSISNVQPSSNEPSSNRTGLIVGLVVGIVGGSLLIGIFIAVFYFMKINKKASRPKKLINRDTSFSQSAKDDLSSRIKPRNLRSMKLAPITTHTSSLPVEVVPITLPMATDSSAATAPTLLAKDASAHARTRGIPLQQSPIRY